MSTEENTKVYTADQARERANRIPLLESDMDCDFKTSFMNLMGQIYNLIEVKAESSLTTLIYDVKNLRYDVKTKEVNGLLGWTWEKERIQGMTVYKRNLVPYIVSHLMTNKYHVSVNMCLSRRAMEYPMEYVYLTIQWFNE